MEPKGNSLLASSVKPLVSVRTVIRVCLGLCLGLALTGQAFAQYGGGMGGTGTGAGGTGTGGTYVPPKGGYGNGKAIGIGVGAAAAGAGVLFFALHHHHGVNGCVQQTSDGMHIVDQKKNVSYALAPGSIELKPGEHVQLAGKKSSSDSGADMFEAKKLVKDYGVCSAEQPRGPAAAASTSGH